MLNDKEHDEAQALHFAKEVGFRVQADGFVLGTTLMDNMREMLLEFYRLAQAEIAEDDGK